jgi:hypothetical protein
MNQDMRKITTSHVLDRLNDLWKNFNHVTSLLAESMHSSLHNNRDGIVFDNGTILPRKNVILFLSHKKDVFSNLITIH